MIVFKKCAKRGLISIIYCSFKRIRFHGRANRGGRKKKPVKKKDIMPEKGI